MERAVDLIIAKAALSLEFVVVVIVLIGGIHALFQLLSVTFQRRLNSASARVIWKDFATAILLALEFALGADIVRTAVAPTWDDIGQLAAIAAIRTGLGYFLGRDLDEFRELPRQPESSE